MSRRACLLVMVGCVQTEAPAEERAPVTAGASTLAGWSAAGYLDGPRDINLFANPVGVAAGEDGIAYVADFDNGKIRAVDRDGTATTLFGPPGFSRPFAIARSGSAGPRRGTTLFVATDNDPAAAHGDMTGTIWRIDVASGTGAPIAQRMGRPRGIAVLPDGRLAVADYRHHVIELVDPDTGTVTPLAGGWDAPGFADGTGADARFSIPYGLVAMPDGSLVVADHANGRLRAVTLDGVVTTVDARGLVAPQALAATAAGDVFVADSGAFRIARLRDGVAEPVAGDGTAGYLDDDDPMAARFYGLEGLAVTAEGTQLYIADGSRGEVLPFNRVRTVELPR
jgi:DNA-binding beta-propeller fold protein YncE